MFPTLYNYSFSYVISHLKTHSASKNLSFRLQVTRKNVVLLKILKKIGALRTFLFCNSTNNAKFLKIYLAYFNYISLSAALSTVSRPSHSFFISLQALLLLNNRSGSSLFILSTPLGILTHKQALILKTGGLLLLHCKL